MSALIKALKSLYDSFFAVPSHFFLSNFKVLLPLIRLGFVYMLLTTIYNGIIASGTYKILNFVSGALFFFVFMLSFKLKDSFYDFFCATTIFYQQINVAYRF